MTQDDFLMFLVSLAPFQETQDTYFILSGLLPGTEYKFRVLVGIIVLSIDNNATTVIDL